MKISSTNFLTAVVVATSIAVASSAFSPANAYSVVRSQEQAGSPAGYLYDVTLDSRYDVGRQLESVQWLVPSGTKSTAKDPSTPIDLKALLNIKVIDIKPTLLSLSLELKNTTDANYIYQNQPFKANILSFGFGVTPNATSVKLIQEDSQTVFDLAQVQNGQQQFPGGFKQIDVCIFAANGCSGGNVNQGLQAGNSDSFQLEISGDFYNSNLQASRVTLSSFPLKFQTSVGSFEPAGVPEPLTIVGSGIALGFGVLCKKEAAKKRKKTGAKA